LMSFLEVVTHYTTNNITMSLLDLSGDSTAMSRGVFDCGRAYEGFEGPQSR
jgi:hypothetical protein